MIQGEIANATPDDARAFGLGAILNASKSRAIMAKLAQARSTPASTC